MLDVEKVMGRVMDRVAKIQCGSTLDPSSVTVECHSSGDSSEKVSSNEVASTVQYRSTPRRCRSGEARAGMVKMATHRGLFLAV